MNSHADEDVRDTTPPWPRGWPPSNYPILLAILLLLGTAIALIVTTDKVANQLAIYAYYLMVVGVSIRLVEYVAEERLYRLIGTGLRVSVRAIDMAVKTVTPYVKHTRFWLRQMGDRIRDFVKRHVDSINWIVEDKLVQGRQLDPREWITRFPDADVETDRSSRRHTRSDQLREIAGFTASTTFIGGLILIVNWWLEPLVSPSSEFLFGWITVVAILMSVYIATSWIREDAGSSE